MSEALADLLESKVGCGYVWGAQGEILTKELLNKFVNMFGRNHYYFDGYSAEKWIGKQVFDCSGLIVWGANKLGIFNGDYTAAGLYNLCHSIDELKRGDLCFNNNLTHVGVYIGNGRYLHAKSTYDGVVITDRYNFTKFGRLKSMATNWDEKNKEFIRYVQKVIGTTVDGLAGVKTLEAFDNYVNSKGNAGEEIKKAWNKFLEAIR